MFRHFPRRLTLDLLLTALFLLLLSLLVARLVGSGEDEILEGRGRVIDGDTLILGETRIRLFGIDAPERAQSCGNPPGWACGLRARQRLAALIEGEPLRCESRGRDRYRRVLAECSVGGRNLNASLVADGLVVSSGSYRREEAEARAAGRGLWSGPFEQPRAWRARHGEMADAPHMGLDEIAAEVWHFWKRWTTW